MVEAEDQTAEMVDTKDMTAEMVLVLVKVVHFYRYKYICSHLHFR